MLPDAVALQRVEGHLSVLGNVIACNDHVTLVHPDVDRKTEEVITDILKVEVSRQDRRRRRRRLLCTITNQGGLAHPKTSIKTRTSLLQVPLVVRMFFSSFFIVLRG